MSCDIPTTSVCVPCSEEDTDSRDSGISVGRNVVASVVSDPCLPDCSEMEEDMEDMVLTDFVENENTNFGNSLRLLKEQGFDETPSLDSQNFPPFETPKSRFGKTQKRKPLQTLSNQDLSKNGCTVFKKCKTTDWNANASSKKGTAFEFNRNLSASEGSIHVAVQRYNTQRNLPELLQVEYSLETVDKPQVESSAFKSISSGVIAGLMESMSEEEFNKRFTLVDCRYPYEYKGGHLRGAINIFEPMKMKQTFYPGSPTEFKNVASKIPIFYCEYSQKRGPRMAESLRKLDRIHNEWRYPDVDYKEIYVLDYGYKKFYEEGHFTHLCDPQSYTAMIATPYKDELKRYNMHRTKSTSSLSAAIRGSKGFEQRMKNKAQFQGDSPTQFYATEPSRKGKKLASSMRRTSSMNFSSFFEI